MNLVFWRHLPVLLLLVPALISAVRIARRPTALRWGLCVGCTTALVLGALACQVPYEEVLLLLLGELLLFWAVAKGGGV